MIGIFDSGSGGLTVLKALKEISPQSEIVYLGDIKNAPYGERSPEQLGALTISGFKLLLEEGVDGILSACNSVSAFTILSVFDTLNIHPDEVIEMAGPTIEFFKKSEHKNAALTATPATINSGLYQNALKANSIKISNTIPIAGLAGAIEFGKPKKEIERTIKNAFKNETLKSDILVLGCTHYPLVEDLFKKHFKEIGQNIEIFNPAAFAAERAVNRFKKTGTDGKIKFIITKDSRIFRKRVNKMFSEFPYEIEVRNI